MKRKIVGGILALSALIFIGSGCQKNNGSDSAELVDFVVEVEAERDVRVLQLTDTQIIRPEAERSPNRLTPLQEKQWASAEENYHKYLNQVIKKTQPDLILLTGDIIYGEFDDSGEALLELIEFMDSFEIPWAPIFGNHENEAEIGVDWQSKQLENAEYCLFKQRELTGNGNYTVGIMQNDKLVRTFFMLDSNGCAGMSEKSLDNGHSMTRAGFGDDQIAWYTQEAENIKTEYPDVNFTFAFHIPIDAFADAYAQYGFTDLGTNLNPINIDEIGKPGDFGYLGQDVNGWDSEGTVWKGLQELGADSVLAGHLHANSASVVYEGVRFQFGQKSSTYDLANYMNENGEIVGSYDTSAGTPIIGGTLMVLEKETGEMIDAEIVLYE